MASAIFSPSKRRGDGVRATLSGSEVQSLKRLNTIAGVAVLSAGGGERPGNCADSFASG